MAPDERGQERVVDVDRAAAQRRAGVVREDLHVAGEHDEVDLELVDEVEQPALGVGLARRPVTGMWWNAMPAASTTDRRSSWLDTTAGMVIGSVPTRVRNRRSLRQCPKRDTSTSVRVGVAASTSSQRMSYAPATAAKPRRTASSV